MATAALRTQVSAKFNESVQKLVAGTNAQGRVDVGLVQWSEAWTYVLDYLRPYDIKDRSALVRPRSTFDVAKVRQALVILHRSRQLSALGEAFLEDVRKAFPLIEREISHYMGLYEESHELDIFRRLISRLLIWFRAWQSPNDLGPTFLLEYTQAFHTRLFAALPPSFARGLKHLAQWCMSPEEYPPMVSSDGSPINIDEMWSGVEMLGLLERYEAVVSSVAFEAIERRVAETCAGKWDEPMLAELRMWMGKAVVPWMLKVFVRNGYHKEEVQGHLSAIGSRFDFHVNKALCALRISEIWDIIVDYPDTIPALQDLRECVNRVDQREELVKALRKQNAKRLLHPGADTKVILGQYVSTIKCLRLIDPPGVLLYKVADPIRQYLRERPDTIRCIVASLVGDDESGDSLLEDNEPIQPIQQPEAEDYSDPNWDPEPIDAGPEFKTNKPSDIISTLVSIYDSKDLFVKELQVLLAQRLLAIKNNDLERIDKERRNIEILKIRFGEAALQVCEVMLRDMDDSKRTDTRVQDQKPSVVHPTIISHHFWPSLESSDLVMPGQFQSLQESYAKEYSVFKPDKKLKWLPHLGIVNLEIELEDRTLNVDVPPLEAAFIELFSQKDIWTLDELIHSVGSVDRSAAVKALTTWVNMGVLKEHVENSFVLLERAEEGVEMSDIQPTPSAAPSLPPAQTLQQQQAEQMRIHWKFIEGMLTNLGTLPLDRIQTMLKFVPGYDQSVEQLGSFMEAAKREGLVLHVNGQWKLNK